MNTTQCGDTGRELSPRIKLDVFLEFASPPAAARGLGEVYADGLALARAADRAGFGAVWIAEHHFLGDYSNAAAPDMLLAAIARETQRIGLGFAVVPLPLHDAVRVAERIATLDLISGGRALWGVGRGVTPIELEAFAIAPEQSRETFLQRYAELAALLRTGEIVRGGRTVCVRPRAAPHLARGWMAAVSPESFPIAAELGLDVMAGPFKPWSWVRHDFARYRSLRPGGRTSFTLACYCERDHDAARRRAGPGILWAFENLLGVTRGFLKNRTTGYEHYRRLGVAAALFEKALTLPVLEWLGLAAVGSAEHVAEKLATLASAGVDRVQLVIGGGDLPRERLEACVALIAERVMPALERAAPSGRIVA
jgi:alkanesulfonate monooxygenase SsuD/methylene tetrahydromethanopterin reductase-like flavin-dependent oxidoreductase (luciferase family)